MTDQGQGNESSKENFTERAIMTLAMDAAEMKEMALRLHAVVGALALAYDISIDV